MKEIPLVGGAANAHQTFSCVLGGKEIVFRLDYLAYLDVPSWSMTLSEDDEILIAGIALRCGCNLLAPYHLGIGNLYLIGDEPTLDNLGIRNTLVWRAENETT